MILLFVYQPRFVFLIVLLFSWVSILVIKHNNQKQLGEKWVYF